jgi:hypothetical protein
VNAAKYVLLQVCGLLFGTLKDFASASLGVQRFRLSHDPLYDEIESSRWTFRVRNINAKSQPLPQVG